jgi:hypothetical protein
MSAILNGKYNAMFTLQYVRDENNKDKAILTVPYLKWLEPDSPSLYNRIYTISGKELECIEKNYFDKNILAIPVKGYPSKIEMPDILEKVIPAKIYNQLLTGTFTISDKATPQEKILFNNNIPLSSNKKTTSPSHAKGKSICTNK